MLMVLFTANGETMSFPSVTSTYITNIGSAAEWSEFCAAVNGGYDYSGVEVRLTDDIAVVSDIAGTSSNCFKGTFDGQGHTITFSKTVTDNTQYTAPFGFIDGATIKNLKVTGTVTSNGRFAGGVVAYAKGSSTVTNCINSTVITSNAYGTSNGGIVGMVGGAGTLTITGCVFNGEMHGTVTEDWCGILGLSNTDCNATITDCLFAPAAIDEGLVGYTIFRQGNGGHASQSNCHYTQTMSNLEGTQVYSVTGIGNVILAMYGDITNDYDVSGLSYYDTGFTFDDIIYAANGESLSLNLDYYNLPEGPGVAYSADHGTLSGESNPYTLEMAASNTTISATILPLRSSNGNYYSWEYFAAHPRDCGGTIYLECDITVTTIVSGQSWNPNTAFNKTFDGQNHTITMAIDTTINEAGLFRYTNNAFFQNLKLEGYIHSTSGNTASLIGLSQEFVSIVDCHSNVTVSNADDQNGVAGFIAYASDIVRFLGCSFTGVLAGTSSEQNGGFVGRYANGREHYFKDCVFAPSSISENLTNGFTFDPYPYTIFYKNCYYTVPFGTPQGKLFHTITGDTGVTVDLDGEATEYSTSGITSYSGTEGLLYNGTIIAGEIDFVKLNLSSEQIGSFYIDNAVLEGTSNPYSFDMPAEDVVVRIAPPVTITVTANPEEYGRVMGGGDFIVNDTCTLVAMPYHGYAFINWTVDGVEVSTDATYKFNVSMSATYVANFEALATYQIIATANDAEMGTVTGAGSYYDTEECTLVAMPKNLYGFVYWTEDGDVVCTDATYTFTVGSDRTLVANFEKIWDYFEDFEGVENSAPAHDRLGLLPTNWDLYYEGSVKTQPHTQHADDYPGKISGEKYLCFNAGDGYYYEDYANYSYAIMPAFANNEVPNHISFKYRFQRADKGVLTFGVIDGTDISTYTVLGTVQSPINNPGTAVVDLDPEQTMGKRIAFRWYVFSYWYTCGIDDIGLNFEPEKQFTNRSGDGKWETANNWHPIGAPNFTNDVTILADVTIGAGVLAKANNITIGSNHTITIEDGGQLIHSNAGVTATVKKNITGHGGGLSGGWNFIASPLVGTTQTSNVTNLISTISENYDLYYYDEDDHYWRNHKESDNSLDSDFDLNNGQGYLYANHDDTELQFTGILKAGTNGTHTVSGLSYACAAESLRGFNLVGNPFACNATIDQSFYVIEGRNVVPNMGSTIIPPCTGVMVKATANGQSVTFTKTTAQQSSQPSQLQIALSQVSEPVDPSLRGTKQSSIVDKAIVSFTEGVQLEKFNFGDNAKLYIPQGGKDFAIAFSEGQGEMPLNFKATENGEYTISVNPVGVEMSYLHLIDNMTGADVDLLTPAGVPPLQRGQGGFNYTFTAKTTDYESRFRLVFICGDANGDDEDTPFAFISNSNIIVNGTGTLQIIDILGRELVKKELSTLNSKLSTLNYTPGVYVLRLIKGDKMKTQKIIIE